MTAYAGPLVPLPRERAVPGPFAAPQRTWRGRCLPAPGQSSDTEWETLESALASAAASGSVLFLLGHRGVMLQELGRLLDQHGPGRASLRPGVHRKLPWIKAGGFWVDVEVRDPERALTLLLAGGQLALGRDSDALRELLRDRRPDLEALHAALQGAWLLSWHQGLCIESAEPLESSRNLPLEAWFRDPANRRIEREGGWVVLDEGPLPGLERGLRVKLRGRRWLDEEGLAFLAPSALWCQQPAPSRALPSVQELDFLGEVDLQLFPNLRVLRGGPFRAAQVSRLPLLEDLEGSLDTDDYRALLGPPLRRLSAPTPRDLEWVAECPTLRCLLVPDHPVALNPLRGTPLEEVGIHAEGLSEQALVSVFSELPQLRMLWLRNPTQDLEKLSAALGVCVREG